MIELKRLMTSAATPNLTFYLTDKFDVAGGIRYYLRAASGYRPDGYAGSDQH